MLRNIHKIKPSCRVCGSRGHVAGAGPLSMCGSCKKAYYCGVRCQSKDWSRHQSSGECVPQTPVNDVVAPPLSRDDFFVPGVSPLTPPPQKPRRADVKPPLPPEPLTPPVKPTTKPAPPSTTPSIDRPEALGAAINSLLTHVTERRNKVQKKLETRLDEIRAFARTVNARSYSGETQDSSRNVGWTVDEPGVEILLRRLRTNSNRYEEALKDHWTTPPRSNAEKVQRNTRISKRVQKTAKIAYDLQQKLTHGAKTHAFPALNNHSLLQELQEHEIELHRDSLFQQVAHNALEAYNRDVRAAALLRKARGHSYPQRRKPLEPIVAENPELEAVRVVFQRKFEERLGGMLGGLSIGSHEFTGYESLLPEATVLEPFSNIPPQAQIAITTTFYALMAVYAPDDVRPSYFPGSSGEGTPAVSEQVASEFFANIGAGGIEEIIAGWERRRGSTDTTWTWWIFLTLLVFFIGTPTREVLHISRQGIPWRYWVSALMQLFTILFLYRSLAMNIFGHQFNAHAESAAKSCDDALVTTVKAGGKIQDTENLYKVALNETITTVENLEVTSDAIESQAHVNYFTEVELQKQNEILRLAAAQQIAVNSTFDTVTDELVPGLQAAGPNSVVHVIVPDDATKTQITKVAFGWNTSLVFSEATSFTAAVGYHIDILNFYLVSKIKYQLKLAPNDPFPDLTKIDYRYINWAKQEVDVHIKRLAALLELGPHDQLSLDDPNVAAAWEEFSPGVLHAGKSVIDTTLLHNLIHLLRKGRVDTKLLTDLSFRVKEAATEFWGRAGVLKSQMDQRLAGFSDIQYGRPIARGINDAARNSASGALWRAFHAGHPEAIEVTASANTTSLLHRIGEAHANGELGFSALLQVNTILSLLKATAADLFTLEIASNSVLRTGYAFAEIFALLFDKTDLSNIAPESWQQIEVPISILERQSRRARGEKHVPASRIRQSGPRRFANALWKLHLLHTGLALYTTMANASAESVGLYTAGTAVLNTFMTNAWSNLGLVSLGTTGAVLAGLFLSGTWRQSMNTYYGKQLQTAAGYAKNALLIAGWSLTGLSAATSMWGWLGTATGASRSNLLGDIYSWFNPVGVPIVGIPHGGLPDIPNANVSLAELMYRHEKLKNDTISISDILVQWGETVIDSPLIKDTSILDAVERLPKLGAFNLDTYIEVLTNLQPSTDIHGELTTSLGTALQRGGAVVGSLTEVADTLTELPAHMRLPPIASEALQNTLHNITRDMIPTLRIADYAEVVENAPTIGDTLNTVTAAVNKLIAQYGADVALELLKERVFTNPTT